MPEEIKMTEQEIKIKYKKLHDDLSKIYYKQEPAGQLSKEDFDNSHGQIWADLEAELIAEGYRTISEPPRDLIAEIDELKEKVKDLEKK